jgi:tRNA nucleotidyltransferase (CCA-adding enzyme)
MQFVYPFQQPMHPLAVEVCRTLQQAGFQAYIVGGCVRDLHLGLTPKDWDITTDASPEKIMELFPRTIPTGLQHGTVTVCMGEGEYNHFEVTTFRVEGEYLDGRRPESVKFVKSVTEDLARRDFTINAMAFDPVDNIGIDPFNGREDLEKRAIRAVGSPHARFQEDGLRIMRAARFAARFGFAIDPHTLRGMSDNLDTLRKVSKERISDELSKTLLAQHANVGVLILQGCGALDIACPLLAGRVLPLISGKYQGELETRLAFLYNRLPTKLVEEELVSLKFSNKEVKKALFLLETLEKYFQFEQDESVATYKRFMARIKNESLDHWENTLEEFILLSDGLGLSEPARLFHTKYDEEIVHSRRAMKINGDDLLEIGIKPGPRFKSILDACYQEILEYPGHNSKEYLLEHVKNLPPP